MALITRIVEYYPEDRQAKSIEGAVFFFVSNFVDTEETRVRLAVATFNHPYVDFAYGVEAYGSYKGSMYRIKDHFSLYVRGIETVNLEEVCREFFLHYRSIGPL